MILTKPLHEYGSPSSQLHMWVNTSEWSEVLVAQSCPTPYDPMDWDSPDSSVHGILQAVVISFSRGSSWPRDWTQVSCIAGRLFTIWATREAQTLQKVESFAKVIVHSRLKLEVQPSVLFFPPSLCFVLYSFYGDVFKFTDVYFLNL